MSEEEKTNYDEQTINRLELWGELLGLANSIARRKIRDRIDEAEVLAMDGIKKLFTVIKQGTVILNYNDESHRYELTCKGNTEKSYTITIEAYLSKIIDNLYIDLLRSKNTSKLVSIDAVIRTENEESNILSQESSPDSSPEEILF